ncbi:ferritin [Clostridium cavendishii DSM 21758]|uniref:Ferritin n=1 Tax=Clostridium cavendishii DSM 21758 TaxID=1121302 RepID=A0A1M6LM29_9CLOT|nr:ferritin [Clostridium cavendishii]SHJ72286.1 ferritin [Clostridium cavendishii DSM 21758]
MLSKNLLNTLNNQVNFEFYSSYTYLAMASYAESIDLTGFANFFRVQAQEELFHAMKFYDYIFQKNGFVELKAIPQPQIEYENLLDVFQKGYDHEQAVTKRIYELADLAAEEREHSTMSLLKWFIDEQVEEENTFNSLIKKLRRVEANPAALYMLDDELATRVFTPPTNA